MISEISLKNFKAFGSEQKIPIKPITLLYGANSSGKSSILQAILMFKQSMTNNVFRNNGQLLTDGNQIKLGPFENVIHNHKKDTYLIFGFTLSKPIKTNNKSKNLDIFPNYKFAYHPDKKGIPKIKQIAFGLSCDNSYFIVYENNGDNSFFEIKDIKESKILDAEKALLLDLISVDKNPLCIFDLPGISKEAIASRMNDNFASDLLDVFKIANYQIKLSYVDDPKYSYEYKYDGVALKMSSSFDRVFKTINIYSYLSYVTKTNFSNLLPKSSAIHTRGELSSLRVQLDAAFGFRELFKSYLYKGFNSLYKEKIYSEISNNKDKWHKIDIDIPCLKINDIAFSNLLDGLVFISKSIYIGPLRSFPKRYYIRDNNQSEFDLSDPTGENIAEKLYSTKGLTKAVNEWFRKLEIPYIIEVSCNENAGLKVYVIKLSNTHGVNITPADVGFGISQILPVIINLITHSVKLIMIEQPEIHLHPKLQTHLGDLLIHSSKSQNNTIIAETHSEHLLLRIMRRIRETTTGKLEDKSLALTPDDVSVLYVESIDGESIVREMPLNEYGELVLPWPGGFFEEGLREVF